MHQADAAAPPPRHRPRWVLPALVGLLLVASALYAANLGASGFSTYYAMAAKAMSETWAAALTGAINPSATITVDKLTGFLLPQALSARLFGFHAWSLDLPQAIEGVVTVAASYVIAARWKGPRVGIATAGVMTVTPILAALFGHATEDALLTMSLVLSFGAWHRYMTSGRFGWLVLAGVWVAIGFQAKMIQAWLILPALVIGILLAGSGALRKRLTQLGIAGAVTGLLSISSLVAMQVVPATDRPYIDGTTNNNAFSMVFAYNGLDRVLPGLIPGGVPQLGSQTGPHSGAGRGTATGDAAHSPIKLLLPAFTSQAGWLVPAALVGMATGVLPLLRRRRRGEPPEQRAPSISLDHSIVLTLAIWTLVTAVVFSAVWVPHASYLGALAFPVALLAVVGAADTVRRYRVGLRRRDRLLLPGLVAIQLGWQLVIIVSGSDRVLWLVPIVAVVSGIGLIALVRLRRTASRRDSTRWVSAAIAVAVVGAMAAPTVWSSFALDAGGSGAAADSYAGPRLAADGGQIQPASASPLLVLHPLTTAADPVIEGELASLIAHVRSHNGDRRWLFATDTLPIAVTVLLGSRDDVLPMGGFSQQAPNVSSAQLRALIDAGSLRYVLLSSPNVVHPPNTVLAKLRSWVRTSCRPDRTAAYRSGAAPMTLYDCRA